MAGANGVLLDAVYVDLEDIKFAPWTEKQVVDHVLWSLTDSPVRSGGWIVTPNVDILRAVATQATARSLVSAATLSVPDGMPLVWASALQGTPLPERVSGASLMESLCAAAAHEQLSVFLVGGGSGVAEQAALRLAEKHSGLDISGWSPPFGLEATTEGMDQIRARVQSAGADLIFCGFGFPKQERIISELRASLPDAWFLGCGASLDFAAGRVARAPIWMQRGGLEWLHRLLLEPRRMFRRYVINDVPFAIRLIARAGVRRVRPMSSKARAVDAIGSGRRGTGETKHTII